jgi:hypothetical protein
VTIIQIKSSTRVVIILKDRVYKIPIDYRGYLQGKNESKVWRQYKHTNKLAPLIWERFGIVCQVKCDTICHRPPIEEVKELIPQLNIDNCDLHNIENWGQYQGNTVLLDYGIDERISKMY